MTYENNKELIMGAQGDQKSSGNGKRITLRKHNSKGQSLFAGSQSLEGRDGPTPLILKPVVPMKEEDIISLPYYNEIYAIVREKVLKDIKNEEAEKRRKALPDHKKYALGVATEEELKDMSERVLNDINTLSDEERPNRKYKDIEEFLNFIKMPIGGDNKNELNLLFELSPEGRGTEGIYYFVKSNNLSPAIQKILDNTSLWRV
jgi:hypothetical protein